MAQTIRKIMNHQKHLDYLCSLRDEIAALRVVKCQMSHERIVRATDTMLPIVCSFPENSYHRAGLCSPEVRAVRLGCSHTMARIKLERGFKELGTGGSGLESSLDYELNWLNNEIHLLDHRKGEAEKGLAGILEEVYSADHQEHVHERLRQAEEEIREMEKLHDEYVERVGVLRDTIVAELEKLIKCDCPTLPTAPC